MGSLREAARDRDWQGVAWSRSLQARLGRVCSYDLSKSAAAFTFLGKLTRAQGAPPREELCARPPAIGIGRGSRVNLLWQPSPRARRAATARPPLRDEPPVSYG